MKTAVCVRCGHRADYHNAFGTMPCAQCDCPRLRLPETPPSTPAKARVAKPRRPLAAEFRLYLADLKACESEAQEALQQIAYLRRNGAGDRCRVLDVKRRLERATTAITRSVNRYRAEEDERLAYDRDAKGTVAS